MDLSSFDVGANYQLLDVIGEGAYGVVWSVDLVIFSHPTLISFGL
jgi:hypothetical protein